MPLCFEQGGAVWPSCHHGAIEQRNNLSGVLAWASLGQSSSALQGAQRPLCSQTSTREPGMLSKMGCSSKGRDTEPVIHPEGHRGRAFQPGDLCTLCDQTLFRYWTLPQILIINLFFLVKLQNPSLWTLQRVSMQTCRICIQLTLFLKEIIYVCFVVHTGSS